MAEAKNLIDREVELPAGAIRVAPVEESVEGTIAFPDAHWNEMPAKGVVITFVKGKIWDVKAVENVEAVISELDSDSAARWFREFVLGFNPLLKVRLSLGDNTELGGKVMGHYVRWNFFMDATVKVNGETWVEHGRMVK
jgi:leucyl aminopeptidase (aminopeptidase T)